MLAWPIAHSIARRMSKSVLEQLERPLVRHRQHLMRALAQPDRLTSGVHGQLAVQLRVLHCDADCPSLLRCADQKMINLYAYGPVQYSSRLRTHMVIHVNLEPVISRNPFVGSQLIDLRS